LPSSHEENLPKSAKRCAIATLPDQHESGTFCPCEGKQAANRCLGQPELLIAMIANASAALAVR
jgi:hypothetical protein